MRLRCMAVWQRTSTCLPVPGYDDADSAEALIESLRLAVNGIHGDQVCGVRRVDAKPHGRRAWTLYFNEGGGPYLDISVMPRKRKRKA